ncbi:MAG: DNA primase [Nitrospiria bacterium]
MTQRSIPNQLIDAIRERSDLIAIVSEHLSLKKTGQNYTGLCPFHEERTPSFVVNPIRQFFHCFGCGEGGDVFHFVEKMEGLSFPEALRSLADRGGIPFPEKEGSMGGDTRTQSEEIFKVNEAAADYFHQNLLSRPEGKPALAYLKARGVKIETIRDFSIGFALSNWDHLLKTLGERFSPALLEKAGLVSKKNDSSSSSHGKPAYFDRFRNRVLFPIHTRQGKVAGFGGRVLDDGMPKYLNTSETGVFTKGKILFGLERAKGTGGAPLVIVEGYFDVITAAQAGIPNMAATLGTALTETHLRMIRRFSEKMMLVFDGDEAGIRAALRTAPLLIDHEVSARIVTLPPGKDPDALIREMGKDAFLAELKKGKPVIDFALSEHLKKSSLRRIEDKMRVIRQIVPLIQRLKSQVEKSHYLNVLSDKLLLREEDVRLEFVRLTRQEKASHSRSQIGSAAQQIDRFPQEEEMILMLLIQGYLDPERLNNQVQLEDFTHPILKNVISHYWDLEARQWRKPEHEIHTDDPIKQALIGRLSVSRFDEEQVKRSESDCINTLRQKKIERECSEIAYQLKRCAENTEEKNALMKKYQDLTIEKSHLAVSH